MNIRLTIRPTVVELGDYYASHADFTTDYGSAPPAPAHPNCTRTYIPEMLHASHTPRGQLGGGPLVWPEGDAMIASLPTLLTKQAARLAAAQAAAQAAREAADQAARQSTQQQQSTPPSEPAEAGGGG